MRFRRPQWIKLARGEQPSSAESIVAAHMGWADPRQEAAVRAFERRVSRYPAEERRTVPMAEVYAIAADVIRPETLGLEQVDERRWVRVEEQRAVVLSLLLRKGRSVTLGWGLSLPYVPHRLTPKPQYHRTPKSARLDLFEDTGPLPPPGLADMELLGIETFFGTRFVRDGAAELWSNVRDYAEDFWARTVTVPGVLAEAERQIETTRTHHPTPAYIAAYAAGRLGDRSTALRHLSNPRITLDPAERVTAEELINKMAT